MNEFRPAAFWILAVIVSLPWLGDDDLPGRPPLQNRQHVPREERASERDFSKARISELIEVLTDPGRQNLHFEARKEIFSRRPECIPELVKSLEVRARRNKAAELLDRLVADYHGESWQPKHRGAIVEALLAELKRVGVGKHSLVILRTLGRFESLPEAEEMIPALIQTMRKDNIIREDCARVLARIGPAAVPALIECVGPDGLLTDGAIMALGGIGPEAKETVPLLAKSLGDEYFASRWRAADALGEIGQPAKAELPALVKAIADPHREVAVCAMRAAVKVAPEDSTVVTALISQLESPSDLVRKGAATALGTIGPSAKAAVPALREALYEKRNLVEYSVAAAVVEALGKIGRDARSAGPRIRELLTNKKVPNACSYRVELAESLWRISGDAKTAVPILEKLEGCVNDREDAVQALGRIGPDASEALIRLLASDDQTRHNEAAKALGTVRPTSPKIVAALTKTMQEATWQQKWLPEHCADALGQIGPPAKSAVPALRTRATNRHDWHAARAVWRITKDPEVAVPGLVEVLRHGLTWPRFGRGGDRPPPEMIKPSHWQRVEAAKLLREIGPPASSALPALREALQDDNAEVRIAAREAVIKIEESQ